jgi:hypothetical protein
MALRRAGDVERASHAEVPAVVVKDVHAIHLAEDPALRVARERVIIPAVPQAAADVHELGRPLIELIMRKVVLTAKVEVLPRHAAGDDVPAGAAAADVVDRGELARDLEGKVVAGGGGADEADVLRPGRQRGHQRERLKVGDVLRHTSDDLRWSLAHDLVVGEEDRVEAGSLGRLGQVDVVSEVHPRVRCRPRMTPRGLVVAGRVDEQGEVHPGVFGHGVLSRRTGRGLIARRSSPGNGGGAC